MITQEIYAHVLSAVRLLLQDNIDTTDPSEPIEIQVHARLWAYVTHAVQEAYPSAPSACSQPDCPIPSAPSAPSAEAPKKDGRSKIWTCVVRFGVASTIGLDPWELIAESDVEIMSGTGALPFIVEGYATEMHPDDVTFPSALTRSAIKERLPQLRNNLGRQNRATLRIEYVVDGASYLCQVDVAKPGA